jgi:hypothetical protein
LPDLSGDIIVSKLRNMSKTTDLPVVLFSPDVALINEMIETKICEKIKIDRILKTDRADSILKVAEKLLDKEEQVSENE